MIVLSTIEQLRQWRAAAGGSVGLIPTMGALHDAHLTLVRESVRENQRTVASIFVNPTQFGPNEDFHRYPRTLDHDRAQLEGAGADAVFVPSAETIYPRGFQTSVTVERVSQGLEGERRPGHFRGVATVVNKLFNLVQPTRAYFGQKDAQQIVVIRRMVADLNMSVEVVVMPTLREADGLAMSSRNRLLSAGDRKLATGLSAALMDAGHAWDVGERDPKRLKRLIEAALLARSGVSAEYVSCAEPQSLLEREEIRDDPVLMSAVVRFGTTRLLDNIMLPSTLNTREGLAKWLGNPADKT
jgi:pantoate--beta-alanine ligase